MGMANGIPQNMASQIHISLNVPKLEKVVALKVKL
jgi:hypothetical protein